MKRKIEPHKQRSRRRRVSRGQNRVSSDGDGVVEIRGNMVYLGGSVLEELREFAREYPERFPS
jgi:hypothetical protein